MPTLGKLRGNYAHCAPEIYFGKLFTENSDLYSFGMILWEMVTRCMKGKYEYPYSESSEIVFHFQIIVQAAKKNIRPTLPKDCPLQIVELIQCCWHKESNERTSVLEVFQQVKQMEETYKKNKLEWDSKCKVTL